MVRFLLIFSVFSIVFESYGQFSHLEQDTLYKKYGLTHIDVYAHKGDTVVRDQVCEMELQGHLILDAFVDSGIIHSPDRWKYENGRLVEWIMSTTFDLNDFPKDSVIISYEYDSLNRLNKESWLSTHEYGSKTLRYVYEPGVMVSTTNVVKTGFRTSCDSTFFRKDGMKRRRVTYHWSEKGDSGSKQLSIYNKNGELQLIETQMLNDNQYYPWRITTFTHREGRLAHQKEVYMSERDDYWGSFKNESRDYHYDERGLLIRKDTYRGGVLTSYESYEYR